MNIVSLGTAGSGKTSLCNAYGTWLKKERKEKVDFVNLDPGAVEYLPYSPDFDIRKYFTIPQIMKKEKLGPNGAILRANELIMEKSDKIIREINSSKSDIILIDTPGQLEPFFLKNQAFFCKNFKENPQMSLYFL